MNQNLIALGVCLAFLGSTSAPAADRAGAGTAANLEPRSSETKDDPCPCAERARWPTDATWVDVVEAGAVDSCRDHGGITSVTIGSVSAIVVIDGEESACRSEEGLDPPVVIDTLAPITEFQARACAAVLRRLCS